MDYTVNTLVDAVRRKANLPIQGSRYTTADIVDFLNEELQMVLLPNIIKVNQEYLVTYEDATIDRSISEYTIPERAIGSALREVTFVDSDGDEHNAPLFLLEQTYADGEGHRDIGVRIRGNKVVIDSLDALPQSYVTLRMYYRRRPGDLIDKNDAAVVTAIDTGTNTLTCTGIPSTWTTNTVIDIIQGTPHFDYVDTDVTISALSGTQVTISDVTGISVGDYLADQYQSPIAQIPVEGHRVMELSAVVTVLMSKNDEKGVKLYADRYKEARDAFLSLIVPRVFGENPRPNGREGLRQFTGAKSNSIGRY